MWYCWLFLSLISNGCIAATATNPNADSFRVYQHTLAPAGDSDGYHMQAQLLGAVEIPSVVIAGIPLYGLSALAFDNDQNILYALSDGGALFHFRPQFDAGKLINLKPLAAYRLYDHNAKLLYKDWADAEGMDARYSNNGKDGDTVLTISFEREHRVSDYRPDGHWIKEYPLPAVQLKKKQNYANKNRSLEAFTWLDSAFEVFVVAPELPLRNTGEQQFHLFTSDGRTLVYPISQHHNAAVVALSSLSDGGMLVLERGYHPLFLSWTAVLRRTSPLGDNSMLSATTLVEFNTQEGWRIDNMEGLTRHHHDRWFVVSDDNKHRFQKTLLLYLRLVGT